MTPAELEDRIRALIGAQADISPDQLDPEVDFLSLGVDSLALFRMTGDLSTEVGVELDPSQLFDHPTIRRFARHVHARLSGTDAR